MLENLLKDLTAALNANTAALQAKATDPVAAPVPVTEPVKAEPAAGNTTAGTPVLAYDKDIKPLALALAKKNRVALTEIWTKFGVKVGTELKPEQFAAALADIQAASK